MLGLKVALLKKNHWKIYALGFIILLALDVCVNVQVVLEAS